MNTSKLIKSTIFSALTVIALANAPTPASAREIPCKWVTLKRTIHATWNTPSDAPANATSCILYLGRNVTVTDGTRQPGYIVVLFNDEHDTVGTYEVTREVDNNSDDAPQTYIHFIP